LGFCAASAKRSVDHGKGMDFELTDEQRLLRDTTRKLMQRHAPPAEVRRLDREREYPYALYQQWVNAGLLRLPFPEEIGGLGGSVTDVALIAEEIAHTSADLMMAYGGNIFCGLNILRNGSREQQQQRWLPKLMAGDVRFSISISEPDAGSDVGARTSAVRHENGWRLNGHKVWASTAGAKHTVINVYVKTDPKAHYREGLSLFLVDNDAPGVALKKLDMLGRRSTGTYEIVFDDVYVDDDRLIGGANKGWNCILSGLQIERIVSSAGNVGAAQGVVDLALQYAKDRKQFGRPIGTNQAIAHMLADMATEVEAARALTLRAARKLANKEDALREISMAKLFSSETLVKVASQGMQIFGGYGYSMEFDMQRWFRDSRAATVAAGSSQMQRNLIAGLMGLKIS
jgi:alkylation response protein AidB-like acyl-CoA dehydrogenase